MRLPPGVRRIADDVRAELVRAVVGRKGPGPGAGAGGRIPISSGIDQHHGMFRFAWVLVDPQDQPILEGMDVVELTDDG